MIEIIKNNYYPLKIKRPLFFFSMVLLILIYSCLKDIEPIEPPPPNIEGEWFNDEERFNKYAFDTLGNYTWWYNYYGDSFTCETIEIPEYNSVSWFSFSKKELYEIKTKNGIHTLRLRYWGSPGLIGIDTFRFQEFVIKDFSENNMLLIDEDKETLLYNRCK